MGTERNRLEAGDIRQLLSPTGRSQFLSSRPVVENTTSSTDRELAILPDRMASLQNELLPIPH